MNEYHKIQSVFKRKMDGDRSIIEGVWTLPEFEYLANNQWVFTEKVDGTNIRVMLKGGDVTFAGRTNDAQLPAPLVARLNERFSTDGSALRCLIDTDMCLYGEGYGAKIQSGGKYRADQDFVLFDVRVGEWWLQRSDIEEVASIIGVRVVPVIGEGTLHDAVSAAKAGITSTWGNFQAEGIVARPKVELKTRRGDRLIAKIKCRDFVSRRGGV